MNKDRIETTFNMVREAMLVVGFSVNYRGIPAVVKSDSENCYLLKTHVVCLKNENCLAHELCHSLQAYETLAKNCDKSWWARDCEQEAMAIEKIQGIGLDKIKLLISVIGNHWDSKEMFSWISYFCAVLENKMSSYKATKPFHIPVSKRKALNALTDALIKKD
jgi:hypothetical protein